MAEPYDNDSDFVDGLQELRNYRRGVDRTEVVAIIENILDSRFTEFEAKMVAKINYATNKMEKVFQEHVEESFPTGPMHLHKSFHAKELANEATYSKIKTDLLMWGLKGVLAVLGVFLFLGAIEYVKQAMK